MRSTERARELGEVFTDPREVNAILDLLQDVNFSSNYLEPGCGSGNFLVEILKRKLDLVSNLSEVKSSLRSGNLKEYQIKSLIALGSIYGIDISDVNILEARERMLADFLFHAKKQTKQLVFDEYFEKAARFVLERNIILGDMLNEGHKIHIFEYSELPSMKLKIRVFTYSDLMFPESEIFEDTPSLFGHVPQPITEYLAIPFEEIGGIKVD